MIEKYQCQVVSGLEILQDLEKYAKTLRQQDELWNMEYIFISQDIAVRARSSIYFIGSSLQRQNDKLNSEEKLEGFKNRILLYMALLK